MLYPTEKDSREIQRLLREFGGSDEIALAHRMIALDPTFPPAYSILAVKEVERGNLDAAEKLLWKALELAPCSCITYTQLAAVFTQRDPDDPLARRLAHLGTWKLALSEEISEMEAEQFAEVAGELGDPADPETYEMLATVEDIRLQKSPPPPEVEQRLRPYVLLNELQRGAAGVVAIQTMEGIIEDAAACVPLLRGALRQWARHGKAVSLDAACLMIAMLGEVAEPEVLEELLELAERRDTFLHVHWAIHRMAGRHPQEALAIFRASTGAAGPGLRCGLAEQMYLMPQTPGLQEALTALLDGFARLSRQDDAPHLLMAACEALGHHGFEKPAELLFTRCLPMLSKKNRQFIQDTLDSEEGFVPTLASEGLDGLEIDDVCLERVLMDEEDEDEEDEEEDEDEDFEDFDDAPPRHPKPGRNEPCWCGSGKKYKKCHLAEDEQSPRRPETPAGGGPPAAVIGEIAEYALGYYTKSELNRAMRVYFEDAGEIDASTTPGFMQWLLTDYRPAGAKPAVIDDFLREESQLSAGERAFAESLRHARFALYEVQEVEPGRGYGVKDLYTGDVYFVHDVTSSRELVRWDCSLSRLHEFEGRTLLVGDGVLVARELLPQFQEWIAAESRAAAQTEAEFVRANSYRLHRLVARMHRERFENLKVVNKEGDVLEFCQANYQVLDQPVVLERLRSREEIHEDPDPKEPDAYHFAWLAPGSDEAPRAVFGQVVIRKGRLRLECNSRKRLKQGRKLLESAARAALKHLGDSFDSPQAAHRRPEREPPAEPPPPIPPEVERELLLEVKSRHYATWPDENLPALDGKTPRQAVKTEAGRRAVLDLIRTLENHEAREGKAGMPVFDFTPLRQALGLERA